MSTSPLKLAVVLFLLVANPWRDTPNAYAQTPDAAAAEGPRAIVARWLELHRTGNRDDASALTTGSDYHRAHVLLPSNRDTGVRVTRSLGSERVAAVVTSALDDADVGERVLLFWLVRRDGAWRINKSDSFELRAVDDRLRGFLEAEDVRWHVERAQLVGDWHAGPGRPPGEDRPTACGIQLQLHDDNRYRLTVDGPGGPVPEYGMQGEWRVANGQLVLSCQDRLHSCRIVWMTDNSLDIEPLDNKGEVTGRARYERAVAAQDQHDVATSLCCPGEGVVVEFRWLESRHTPNKTCPDAIKIGESDYFAELKPFLTRSSIQGVVGRTRILQDGKLVHVVEFFPSFEKYCELSNFVDRQGMGLLGVFIDGKYSNSHSFRKNNVVYKPLLSGVESKHWVQKVVKELEGECSVSSAYDVKLDPIEIEGGHEDLISEIALTNDRSQIYTSSLDKSVRVWQLSSGIPVSNKVLGNYRTKVISVAASSDGNRAVSAGYLDRPIRVWNSGKREFDLKLSQGDLLAVNAVSISPNGRWIIVGGIGRNAYLWDMNSKNPETSAKQLENRRRNKTVHWNFETNQRQPWIDISKDGRWAVTGSGDREATLWDLTSEDPTANPIVLGDHDETMVNQVAFSPNSQWVATGGWGDSARLWRLNMTPSTSQTDLSLHGRNLDSMTFSPNGRWLALCNKYSSRLWNLQSRKPANEFLELFGHHCRIIASEFSPNGRWFVVSGRDKTLRIWDLTHSPPASTAMVVTLDEYVSTLCFTLDDILITGTANGSLKVWDLGNLPH